MMRPPVTKNEKYAEEPCSDIITFLQIFIKQFKKNPFKPHDPFKNSSYGITFFILVNCRNINT